MYVGTKLYTFVYTASEHLRINYIHIELDESIFLRIIAPEADKDSNQSVCQMFITASHELLCHWKSFATVGVAVPG